MPHLAETARYFPSWMEILIQVGVVSAAMLVWYFALRYLPILPRKRA
jgi:Ni/Fe-hydrogenase subunit HybB-like protein